MMMMMTTTNVLSLPYKSITSRILQHQTVLRFRSLKTAAAACFSPSSPGHATDPHDELAPSTCHIADDLLLSSSGDDPWKQRVALSKAITLTESTNPVMRHQANLLLQYCVSHKPVTVTSSFRLGFAGAPGSGKSTLIEALGKYVLQLHDDKENEQDAGEDPPSTAQQQSSSLCCWSPRKLAVLCIDPSSKRSGGSILGDKTRMTDLSRHHGRTFIRPAPTSGTLGGLSEASPEIILLCGVAEYDLVIVETVGVGQSETELEECVDCMVLCLPPAGGDALQGVKKGIMEACHLMVVTKADGHLLPAAKMTAAEYKTALPFLDMYGTKGDDDGDNGPKVLVASSVTGDGLAELWTEICQFRQRRLETGKLQERRNQQATYWMWKHLQTLVLRRTKEDTALKRRADVLTQKLAAGSMTPRVAAQELLESLQRTDC